MPSDNSRKFSLDKHEVDPQVLNRIMSADGDQELGTWNGESIHDLVEELDRIEEFADANYAALPHQGNIPEDLRPPVSVDFPIWTCDRKGLCLTGENANDVVSADDIRAHYQTEFGGTERFREKILRDIRERNEGLGSK